MIDLRKVFFMAEVSGGNDVPDRSAVDVTETWNTSLIFADEASFEKEFTRLKACIPAYASYPGTLKDAAVLKQFLQTTRDDMVALAQLYVYTHLESDVDTGNAQKQGLQMRAMQLAAEFDAAISFFEAEVASWPEGTVASLIASDGELVEWTKHLDEITRKASHTLSEREERIFAAMAPVLGTGSQVFGILSNADFKFPLVPDEDGQQIELTHSRYGRLLESRQRNVRRAAFEGMYQVFGQFKNTTAGTLSSVVKRHNVEKMLRGYESARAAALFANAIPEAVYDNLVKSINDHISLLHRYTAMRKKRLGIDELYPYDLYVPLVDDVDMKFTFAEAQELILKALAPLGDDYLDILRDAFANRWIDRAENRGKRSGAYSSGTYGTLPYILLNWQGRLSDVFTLAHELGHSVHTYYACQNQPAQYADYSIFLAEIASTLNENLLANYLLQTLTDPAQRLFIVNDFVDGFKATVFRQTQFAEFEQLIHQADDQGIALTADYLTEQYGALNKRYYGESLADSAEIALEWSRIPHFYYNFYVYQYATGMSAAAAFAKRILDGEPGAVENYKQVLKAGSSDYPIEVLKQAGLDMTEPRVVEDALATFETFLSEME